MLPERRVHQRRGQDGDTDSVINKGGGAVGRNQCWSERDCLSLTRGSVAPQVLR